MHKIERIKTGEKILEGFSDMMQLLFTQRDRRLRYYNFIIFMFWDWTFFINAIAGTAVHDWLHIIPLTHNCRGEKFVSVINVYWLFHSSENSSKASLIKSRYTRCRQNRCISLQVSSTLLFSRYRKILRNRDTMIQTLTRALNVILAARNNNGIVSYLMVVDIINTFIN